MQANKLKIYTETNIIPQGTPHSFILIPFLGIYSETNFDPDNGRFNSFYEKGKDLFELTDKPEFADYFVLPFGYSFDKESQELIKLFLEKAQSFNKKTIVFYNSDDDTVIQHEHIIVYRTSLNKSKKQSYEHALPGWSIDFATYFPETKVTYKDKELKPTVSYCGYVDFKNASTFDRLKKAFAAPKLDNESIAKEIRGKACRIFNGNKEIETNFIIRNGFWAFGMDDKRKARQEYALNMMSSIYSIVARGGGNFSYRLYEVLSCGRIPVFINTDCVLPFEESIRWKEQMVFLEENQMDEIDRILLNFHSSISNERLLEIQKSNRELYVNTLSPLGFFTQLSRQLKLA